MDRSALLQDGTRIGTSNTMYGIVALIGSIGSFLTFCMTSHATLLMARAVTGISIGGASPVLFSLLSDLFSVDKRNLVVALVGFSISLGKLEKSLKWIR